jgi:hypothetical protein
MPNVKLDIAGMYFGLNVDVMEGATVKDVMDAAVAATANNAGTRLPTFLYSAETVLGKLTVNTITVVHRENSAKSRQAPEAGSNPRHYPNGVYSYSDDSVILKNNGLRALDPNRSFVLAWQYYVYDGEGIDLARMRGGSTRKVVSFAETVNKGYDLKDGYSVVWRLIAIFTRPTHDDLSEIANNEETVIARFF